MQYTCTCILILVLAISGGFAKAQAESAGHELFINSMHDYPDICTSEEAMEFYASLDSFQQLIGNIELVTNTATLKFWLITYRQWSESNWNTVDCNGADYYIDGLKALAFFRLLENGIGDAGEIPAQNVLYDLRKLAAADISAIKMRSVKDSDLEINLAVTNLPSCNDENTLEFYNTFDDYGQQIEHLALVDDWRSLKVWVGIFHVWREKAWAAYYSQPCGLTLPLIYLLETRAYAAGIMHVYDESTFIDIIEAEIQGILLLASVELEKIGSRSLLNNAKPDPLLAENRTMSRTLHHR